MMITQLPLQKFRRFDSFTALYNFYATLVVSEVSLHKA